MSDELERRLQEAFDAQARASIADSAVPPQPRFATEPASERVRWTRRLAPFAAAAVVLAVIGGVVAVARSGSSHNPATAADQQAANAVHVRLHNDDGATYGVGMPVIAYFSRTITDGRSLQQATVATVDGRRVQGAWYFEKSSAGQGPIEAHFRLNQFWPADSDVKISMPIKGLSAGGKLTYDDNLTTEFRTGPRMVAVVDDQTHQLVLKRDGKQVVHCPVSLGAATRPGVKVIMEKPGTVTMTIGGKAIPVTDAQRLTYGGEYLVAAPWATADIKGGVDASNGSTLLDPKNAQDLFAQLHIGDIVTYEHTKGTPMGLASGYGDWNVDWTDWLTGGLVPTR